MVNTTRLRCMVGWLGIALPWIVVFLLMAFPESISATYYFAKTITPFMIILGSAGVLLISYRGYDKIDDIVNTVAGIAGICICLFPCSNTGLSIVGTFSLQRETSGIVHNISAIVFFALLSINSLFLFTKTETPRGSFCNGTLLGRTRSYLRDLFNTPPSVTDNKRKRNYIYRICGIGMILSFAILFIPIPIATWLCEAIALFFFGISFLTKANYYSWLFADEK